MSISKAKTKSSLFSLFKFLIGWPISIIALFFIFIKIIAPNTSSLSIDIKNTNFPLLILGIVCFMGYFLIRAILWNQIIKKLGYNVPLKQSLFLWEISETKRFVPGSIWSIIGRASHFSGKGIPAKKTLKALLYEAQFLLIGSLIVTNFGILTSNKSLIPLLVDKNFTSTVINLIILIGVLIFIFNKYLYRHLNQKPWGIIKQVFNGFSSHDNLALILMSSFYMFLFSLGTYFTISSIVSLNFSLILEFTGLFSFSLLIGYLSFIAPMGLGVREGVLVFGLSQVIPLAIAGFTALYSRIILIFTEVIFLALTFLWYKTKNK